MPTSPRRDMPEKTCETCRYWDGTVTNTRQPGEAEGLCRRFPPRGAWAATFSGDWCGEYQAATFALSPACCAALPPPANVAEDFPVKARGAIRFGTKPIDGWYEAISMHADFGALMVAVGTATLRRSQREASPLDYFREMVQGSTVARVLTERLTGAQRSAVWEWLLRNYDLSKYTGPRPDVTTADPAAAPSRES